MRKSSIVGSTTSFVVRLVVCVALAASFAACGDGEDPQQRRNRMAMGHRSQTNERMAPPEDVLDSLRAMKTRFGITRDEYWDGHGGVLANDFFELWYPPGGTTVTHGMYAFKALFGARKEIRAIFAVDPGERLKVICTASLLSFRELSGFEWWVYSKVEDDQIYYQPIDILYQRTLADMAVARGYYVWGVRQLSRHRAPEWYTQGFASMLSDEDAFLEPMMLEFPKDNLKMTFKQIESGIKKVDDRESYRIALYNSYRMVRRLVARYGRDKIAESILLMGQGESAKKAFEQVYGQPYDNVVDYALEFKINL